MAGSVQSAGAEGGRRNRRRKRATMVQINMTPLVDVMLVLLIVFMITAPLLSAGVTVALPQADSAPIPGEDEPLSVTIDAKGEVFIQDTPVTLDQLAPRLEAIVGRKAETRIFVRGDKGIDYGKVMAGGGTNNPAGVAQVAVLTAMPPARTAAGAAPRPRPGA